MRGEAPEAMARPVIEAISAQSLREFADFLAANMSIERTAGAWVEALSANWLPATRPRIASSPLAATPMAGDSAR